MCAVEEAKVFVRFGASSIPDTSASPVQRCRDDSSSWKTTPELLSHIWINVGVALQREQQGRMPEQFNGFY
jgi:hypothetical protein